MNKELADKAIKALKEQQLNGDTESAHIRADDVLATLLTDLGYGKVVKEFWKVDKWYA